MLIGIIIVTLLVSIATIFAPVIIVRRRKSAVSGSALLEIMERIAEKDQALVELFQNSDDYASTGQVEYASTQITEVRAAIIEEKEQLRIVEEKLQTCQQEVENKEANQQEVKNSREEDDRKLGELFENYGNISRESILLEQNLANALKDLDALIEGMELNPVQNAVLHDLSEALSSAGGRLRELLGDYESIHNRLQALQTQHTDLDGEYTKLVERHLGN